MPRFARFRFCMILLIGLSSLGFGPAHAESAPSDGIRQFDDALLDSMKNAAALGVKGRYKKLEPVILGVFDVPYMTKVAVGSTWNTLPPEQKQRAWTAFGRFVTATYAAQFDGYSGENFKIVGEQKIRHGTLVRTELVKSSGEPIALNYVVHDNDIGWQIRDVYLTSTISQIATRRSEFAALLKDGGIENLITTLNKKADGLLG
jgi:phospholipid transport system substrate-binding protein